MRARTDTEGFGPLKLVLGSILATCTNRQVCLQHRPQSSTLTRVIAGSRRRREQDRRSHLTCRPVGQVFPFAPKERGGSQAPR